MKMMIEANKIYGLKNVRYQIMLAVVILFFGYDAMANNIQINNAILTDLNTNEGNLKIQFNISWENSWRTDNLNGSDVMNWDAAWVFLKYKSNGTWKHAWLNNIGNEIATDKIIEIGLLNTALPFDNNTNPAIGVFIYSTQNGTGLFSSENTKLQWNFAANGLVYEEIEDVKIFAIEMVHVPEGSYFLGGIGTEIGKLYQSANSSQAFQVTSEGEIITSSNVAGHLWGSSGISPTSGVSPTDGAIIPSSFPKGFKGFYAMKYSVSQKGYVDFLNTLSYSQQNLRTASTPNQSVGTGAFTTGNADRNGIAIQTSGISSTIPAVYACNLNNNGIFNEPDDGTDIACNHLSWSDLAAYLDWAGLRPMSELEFEKSSRGIVLPLANESAWGTALFTSAPYTLADAGSPNEQIASNYSISSGNALTSSTNGAFNGPVRVGVFAANSNNNSRITAGATFYGIMEMSGNLFERCVTIGNSEGRAFIGNNGDGILDENGNHNENSWPGIDAEGSGSRGGNYTSNTGVSNLADRTAASYARTDRIHANGGRGVRTAP
jgi:formylglycine-generating enzyme required for sulfatase activity